LPSVTLPPHKYLWYSYDSRYGSRVSASHKRYGSIRELVELKKCLRLTLLKASDLPL
jgi:hypothetical protein